MRNFGMDANAQRWLGAVARNHYWRVAAWHDLEDLLQDGLTCWQLVLVRYPQAVTVQHRMTLFKRIYLNHLHQLANKRSMQVPEMRVISPFLQTVIDEHTPDPEGDNFMLRLLDEAPPLLRRCLGAIVANPALLNRPHRRWPNGRRETTNEWLARLIGIDPASVDLHGQLCELLSR